MNIWQKLKSMATTPIPGFTRVGFWQESYWGQLVLCIALPIQSQRKSILVENTSGKSS